LHADFESSGAQAINFNQFKAYLYKYDPNISEARAADLFAEASQGNQTINSKEFCRIIIQYGIGGYGLGPFMIRELMESLSARKNVVDVKLSESKTGEDSPSKGTISGSKSSTVEKSETSTYDEEEEKEVKKTTTIKRTVRKKTNK